MLHNTFTTLLMCSSIIFLVTSLWLMFKVYKVRRHINLAAQVKPHYKIAIFAPSLVHFVLDVIRPFSAYIKKYASFEFEIIECIHHLDRNQAQRWANFMVENNINLILAIGVLSTETIYNTIKLREHKIPIISGGASSAHEPGLETMQNTVPFTAVSTCMDWQYKIALLKKIIPHIKTVLIIVRSMDEISRINLQEKNTLTATLRKMQISWKMHHAPNIEKSTDLTAELLEGVDIIILSRSSEVLRHTTRIAQEAQQFNVPLLSPDISSPDIFIGMSESPERTIGIQCAKYAIEILEDGMNASALPLKEVHEKKKIVIYPHNSSPMMAATVIGNLLTQTNQIHLVLNPKSELK